MPDSIEDQIKLVEKLRNDAKLTEAIDLIEKIETNPTLKDEDRLLCLNLKGELFYYLQKHKLGVELGKKAHELSHKLNNDEGIIDSLFNMSNIIIQGQVEEGFKILDQIENLLKTAKTVSPEKNNYWNCQLNLGKGWGFTLQFDFDNALEYGKKAFEFAELTGAKTPLGFSFVLLANIFHGKNDIDKSLRYFNQSLAIWEEAKDLHHISVCNSMMGQNLILMGEYDQALKHFERSSAITETNEFWKIADYTNMGRIYTQKGELNRGLDYLRKALALVEKIPNKLGHSMNLIAIGRNLILQGDFNESINYLEQGLEVAEQLGNPIHTNEIIFLLLTIYLEKGDGKKAHFYLNRLKQNVEQNKDVFTNPYFILGKALTLKTSKITSDIGEAEKILVEFIKEDHINFLDDVFALTLLCEILLGELQLTNNTESFDEIIPLIDKLQAIAEKQHSYKLLAETYLLKAKFALIQNKTDEAQKLLSEAQRTADWHGLNYLAHKISSEHDKLLEQSEVWEKLNKTNAPMSERIKLASFDGVMGRLKDKRAVEPPKLIKEEPIMLMIMDKAGASYFNYPFLEGWDHNDLFSSFLSAFNTFSDEMFSKSIDRIKIGENTILINPIEPFMVCYVIKGQSYPAIQKLDRFTETIKNNSEIWNALNKSVMTSEVLSLNKPSSLGSVVNEIFL